ncbi:unnamed protein product, partial [Polarella glacialis]
MNALASEGHWQAALELLRSTGRSGGVELNLITFNSAITATERGLQWTHALWLLQDVRERGIEPGVITFSAAISAVGKCGVWAQALNLLAAMCAQRLEGSVIGSASALLACCEARTWTLGLTLISAMNESGLRPDATSYGAASFLCEQYGHVSKEAELMTGLLKGLPAAEESDLGPRKAAWP